MESNTTAIYNQTTLIPPSNITNTLDDDDDAISTLKHWHVYLESVFIGVICALGILGNVIAIRNSMVMVQYVKQHRIIAFSLSISDFLVCLVRGPCLIYVLFNLHLNNGQLVCEIWMYSAIFVILSIVTDMIVAIERYMIVNSFHKYVKLFTPKHMIVLFSSLWVGIAGLFIAVYIGFGFQTSVLTRARSCTVSYNTNIMTVTGATAITTVSGILLGFIPLAILVFCYVSIVYKICQAGLLKLDKIEEKISYTRVTYISCARMFLMISCLTPYCFFTIIGPTFPDVIAPNFRYVDYILIIQSMVCPYLAMQDIDFRETFSRRRSRYFTVFLTAKQRRDDKPQQRSNISSADLKTM